MIDDYAAEIAKIEVDQAARYVAAARRDGDYQAAAVSILGSLDRLPALAAYIQHPTPVWLHCSGHTSGAGLLLGTDGGTVTISLGVRPKRAATGEPFESAPFTSDGHTPVGDAAEVLTWQCDTCGRTWTVPAVAMLRAAVGAVTTGNLTVYP